MIFLSYAKEDERTATVVAKGLRARGFTVYDWRDPERQAGRFIEEIEGAIQHADAYVALVSPYFMASPWCQRERELALQHELDLQAGGGKRVFIYVLRIAPVTHTNAGFLRGYAWLDMTTEGETALQTLAERLGPVGRGEPMKGIADIAGTGIELAAPLFRNRREELDKVLRGLINPAGPHFWLVVAPPQLGKTWFLHRISAELEENSPGWAARLVDIRHQPAEFRRDARSVLVQLFPPRGPAASRSEWLGDIATTILESGKPCLCLIDSAELLYERTITSLRKALSEIYRKVQDGGRDGVWLTLVVASRREEHWRGVNLPPRLEASPLTEFPPAIVQQALRDLAKEMNRSTFSAQQLTRWANQVHRQSEGLPRLLVAYQRWIRVTEWVRMQRLGSPDLFTELGHPYIRDRLLSADSLIPMGVDRDGKQRRALVDAFRVLAPYRLFTRSHLAYHNDQDDVFRQAREDAGWTIEDLWEAISGTALLVRPLDELWEVIYPAIRRLLYRYYYVSREEQAAAHHKARKFMEAWSDQQYGKEQAVGLVECLWHEAAEVRLIRPTQVKQELMESAAKLSRAIRPSSAYTVSEVRRYAAERLRNDEELQQNADRPANLLRSLTRTVLAPDPKELQMTENALFPQYIPRPQESLILDEVVRVTGDGQSRVVLLYGPGGVGKTRMVRELAESGSNSDDVVWVKPVDVDDPEYWLLSRLERHVMEELDPTKEFFQQYREYLGRLPVYPDLQISYETLISRLGQINRVFAECYKEFAERTGKAVVIVLDTVETIRGTYLLLTLTQWIKMLPATLFILVGRPMDGQDEQKDPIRRELSDPHQGLLLTSISLGDFPEQAARDYLAASAMAEGVTKEEREKLVRLSRGHPLWLAFTIAYLWERGVPEEAGMTTLAKIKRNIPYTGRMTPAGTSLHEDFKRRLMTPYREAGFWPEAVRRLAVVRQSLSESAWQRLMSDVTLPDGVSDHQAWERLLTRPWIRVRANGHQVTLHDAVAEELAQRIIPVHDQSKAWRRNLWRRSVMIYRELIDAAEADFTARAASIDDGLREFRGRQPASEDPTVTEEDRAFLEEVSGLDAQKNDLDQLRAAWLNYQLLSDHEAGCRTFLALFDDARRRNDVIFLDLLAYEMQRFLPSGESLQTLDDVIGGAIGEFRSWLEKPERSGLYLDIALAMAEHLIRNEQPEIAIELLANMPEPEADHARRFYLGIQRGNAHMRIPDHMEHALSNFRLALVAAQALTSDDRYKKIAKAHKELGFYYRNAGMWPEADGAYRQARDALMASVSSREPDDREEIASIQTNWAYVKGLIGNYRYGQNLVESAITIRQRIGNRLGEGNSWSVYGELYRFERRFHKAWEAYAKAQEIFDLSKNWPWLGLIYQEQAICLFQAAEEGINLLPEEDPIKEARRLIRRALDICHDQAIRNYPSALNRAGRIFGRDDIEAGFKYLTEGIDSARQLSDGWFYFANLIEHVELSYRAWLETREDTYLRQIDSRVAEVEDAMEQYKFADLRGRWLLVQGHLAVHRWLEAGDDSELDAALADYREGFALIAGDYVGSSGASAIPGEFRKFRQLFDHLPPEVKAHWRAEFRLAWEPSGRGGEERGSTLLLARLEELY